MKKRMAAISFMGLICALLIGCGSKNITEGAEDISVASEPIKQKERAIEEAAENDDTIDSDRKSNGEITADEMDRIIEETGLENAIDYNDEIENISEDRIVLLCKSPSGRYEAYGFISSVYGKQGILLNDIIDGEDNHNYFYEKWAYSDEQPSLSESDDFYHVTFTICQEGEMKQIHFSTYDTGTMSPEEWEVK